MGNHVSKASGSSTSSRAGSVGTAGSKPQIVMTSNTQNGITMTSQSTQSYTEGAIHQKRINQLMDSLEGTRSKNGAQRIVKSLENVKNTIQTQIDTATFQISRGQKPSVDLPSLKKAMGDVNRAIATATKRMNNSPSVGSGGRKTKLMR